ncbi:acyl-CoA dehydrogenase family protein [Brevundimonas sp.]|uniref:acyl-CoA dehydrogenase family protein n=1 Tax=Brevundimonas sp. TaxID=1871086 RepID=UPI00286D10FB|nr:acyl-CoA dehydrogenase family protein [Brevundimonas sp.]
MNFDLSEEQSMLADSLSGYLTANYGFEARKAVVASEAGWSTGVWSGFAHELGILGALAPEAVGGLDGGAVEAMILMEAAGKALVVEPLMETAVVGVGLLKRAGGERADAVLQSIVEGTAVVAFGHGEPRGRHALLSVATTAARSGDGWVLSGAKAVVSAAPWATHLIVSARTSGGEAGDPAGLSLFLIEVAAHRDSGLSVRGYPTVDDRHAAEVVMERLVLPADALLGIEGEAFDALIAPVMDEAVAALCAEAVGVLRELHGQTLDYVKQRKQFGRPIGEFQVLQHRLADMFMAVEQAVSLTYMATLKLGEPAAERGRAVSAAKFGVSKALRFVGQNAVQTHGGIGVTDELALSHYFRRASAIEIQLGSVEQHLRRFIALAA